MLPSFGCDRPMSIWVLGLQGAKSFRHSEMVKWRNAVIWASSVLSAHHHLSIRLLVRLAHIYSSYLHLRFTCKSFSKFPTLLYFMLTLHPLPALYCLNQLSHLWVHVWPFMSTVSPRQSLPVLLCLIDPSFPPPSSPANRCVNVHGLMWMEWWLWRLLHPHLFAQSSVFLRCKQSGGCGECSTPICLPRGECARHQGLTLEDPEDGWDGGIPCINTLFQKDHHT